MTSPTPSAHSAITSAFARISAELTALREFELAGMAGEFLSDHLVAIHDVESQLHAHKLRATAAFDASGEWELDGAASAAGWMRAHLRMAPGAARSQVGQARAVRDHLPLTLAALSEGVINAGHVRELAFSTTSNPARRAALADGGEELLVAAARDFDPRALGNIVKHWTNTVDAEHAARDDLDLHTSRYLSVSQTFGGVVAVDGLLDPDSGTIVITALEALENKRYTSGDDRSAKQRRADALVDLARLALDHGELFGLPEVAGARPHVSVTIPVAVAQGFNTGGAAMARAGAVSADTALRYLCDASLLPTIIVNEQGKPLDLGRTTRTIPPHLRKAVTLRDQHCVFTGCDRPASWCEAHHLIPWSHGGPTSLENLVLICRRHHHAVHEGGYTLHGTPGHGLTTKRPDGRTIRINHHPADPRPG